MKVAIVGIGLIGGSILKALQTHSITVYSFDKEDPLLIPEECDFMVLATPISEIIPLAEKIAAMKRKQPLLVIDVGSVKKQICERFEALSTEQIEFLSTHPMAGKEKNGFEESSGDLFHEAPWVLLPHRNTQKKSLDKVHNFVHLMGAKALSMTADEHDEAASWVSHLPMLLSKEYLDFVKETCPEAIRIAGPGFLSFTRLAHDKMQKEILNSNKKVVEDHLVNWLSHWMKKMKTPLSASPTVKLHNAASQNKKIFNFAAGDPILELHESITKSVQKKLIKEKMTPYPPLKGVLELREAACSWMHDRFCVEETIITPGGKFALYAILQALLEYGDHVLVPTPAWVSYIPLIQNCGAKEILVVTTQETGWKVTVEALEKTKTGRAKLLILNNGNNPTGVLYNEEEIESILEWATKNEIFVLSDEVYSELVYDGARFVSCAEFPKAKENVAIVQSCSKNFGMTGWRVGFAFAPKHLIDAISITLSQTTTGVALISQWGALAALQNAAEISSYVRGAMCKRRDLFEKTFQQLFGLNLPKVSSALYQFIPLEILSKTQLDAQQYCERALRDASVAMVPGDAFSTPGYIRLAFSEREEQIVEGLKQLHLLEEK